MRGPTPHNPTDPTAGAEVLRKSVQTWTNCLSVQTGDGGKLIHIDASWRNPDINGDVAAVFGKNVTLTKLGTYRGKVVVRALAASYDDFINGLRKSKDAVVRFTYWFIRLAADIFGYEKSIQVCLMKSN